MKTYWSLIVFAFSVSGCYYADSATDSPPSTSGDVEGCGHYLPDGLTLDTEVFWQCHEPFKGLDMSTVRAALNHVGAHIQNGIILDRRGRDVYFYRCFWEDPDPPEWAAQKLRARHEEKRQELVRLRSVGTVIEIVSVCGPRQPNRAEPVGAPDRGGGK